MNNLILIVEDDPYITKFMNMAFVEEGYSLLSASTGHKALELFSQKNPDFMILDLGLPDIDGLDIIQEVRKTSQIPIIVVSARLEEQEKIKALDLGANDYVVKPFYMGELLARIRVMKRMLQMNQKEVIDLFEKDGLKVNFETHQVSIDDHEIHLTPMEFNLLKLLIENRGKVVTHNYLQKEIWGYVDQSNQNALRVFMATLRRKIEKDTNHPQFILTEVGVGYRFKNE